MKSHNEATKLRKQLYSAPKTVHVIEVPCLPTETKPMCVFPCKCQKTANLIKISTFGYIFKCEFKVICGYGGS